MIPRCRRSKLACEVANEALPDMLFSGRSGSRQILVLADSGASGCLIGTKTAAEIGLAVTPWTHGDEGFECANQEVMKVEGTATLPMNIQRYAGKTEVHVIENLPEGIDVILGSDWMTAERAVLDYDKMVIRMSKYGCSLTPANQMKKQRQRSFFRAAHVRAEEIPEDPAEEKRAKMLGESDREKKLHGT